MRLSWRWLGRAILLLPLLLVAGCSGVNATGTVSPLMFLVPGLGQTAPQTIAPLCQTALCHRLPRFKFSPNRISLCDFRSL
jgi:hypothetical protein